MPNLLEYLIAFAISAMLSVLAFSYWHTFTAQRAVNHDTQLLAHALQSAQIRAMTSHQTTRICGNPECTAPLQQHIVIVSEQGTLFHTSLTGKNHLITRAFPARKDHQFTFTPQGMTDFQNASIYICSNQSPIAKQLRINQAGRVTQNNDNTFTAC